MSQVKLQYITLEIKISSTTKYQFRIEIDIEIFDSYFALMILKMLQSLVKLNF